MDKILIDSEGNVVKANIISDIPEGFEDITDIVINPEKMDEIDSQHLDLQVIPEVVEVQAEAAYWSNGIDTVYDSNDIPTIEDADGNAVLDPDYVKTNAVAYVAPEVQKYELVKKDSADQDIATQKVQIIVKSAIEFGSKLLVEFATENVIMGITQDGMTKVVRQEMAEVASALSSGSLYDAIEEIDAIQNKDGKYITDERLAVYKQKIVDYLAQ